MLKPGKLEVTDPGRATMEGGPVSEAERSNRRAAGGRSQRLRNEKRLCAPVILAAVFSAAAFLAASLPAACEPGTASTSTPKPDSPKSNAIPEGLYSVHAERLRDPAAADPNRMAAARVVRVVDGDTVVAEIRRPAVGLSSRETVRLIGVDAPELGRGSRPADPGGPESAAAARALLEGREVLLAFDRELRDRYGRVLAYLYNPGGGCLNLRLLETGAARALLKYPFAFSAAFERAEREARAARKGLFSELCIP